MSRLRVVIADDQPMMRAGFKAVLEAAGDIDVVAEAGTGAEAVDAAQLHTPDVVQPWGFTDLVGTARASCMA